MQNCSVWQTNSLCNANYFLLLSLGYAHFTRQEVLKRGLTSIQKLNFQWLWRANKLKQLVCWYKISVRTVDSLCHLGYQKINPIENICHSFATGYSFTSAVKAFMVNIKM